MLAPAAHDDESSTRTTTAYWGTAYFFAVAILYLWGYWSAFDINILEYVSLSDIVKTAAFPIASVFAFMAVGALVGEIVAPRKFASEGGGAHTRLGRWLRRRHLVLAIGYGLATLLLFLFGPVEKWRILPALLAFPVSLALKQTGALNKVIKIRRGRTTLMFLLAALPPFAYGHGVLTANEILSGQTYSYVTSSVAGHAFDSKSRTDVRLRYVGKAGDQYFLYVPETESVLVLSVGEAKSLELKAFRATATPPRAPSKAQ